MNTEVIFSSKNEVWATPQDFYDELNKEFDFNLDPCALPTNAKCQTFYTPEQDGLKQNWEGYSVFCNPPYGRKIAEWVRKCSEESKKPGTQIIR